MGSLTLNNLLEINLLDIEYTGIITPIKATDMGVKIDKEAQQYFEGVICPRILVQIHC